MKRIHSAAIILALSLSVSLSSFAQASLSAKLFDAIREDKAESIRLLLSQGANIEARDEDGFTPLMYAAVTKRVNAVAVLLNAGANIEATDPATGETPLHWAIGGLALQQADSTGKIAAIVKLLVEHGANIEARNGDGYTPLLWMVERGTPDMVRLLLDHGANLEATNKQGKKALDIATQSGKTEIARLIEQRIEAQKSQGELDNKLVGAMSEGSADKVQLLLDAGANVEARLHGATPFSSEIRVEWKTVTPLLLAVALDKPIIARLLLDHQANINSVINIEQETYYPSYYHSFPLEQAKGPNSPLTLSIELGKFNLAQLLLAQGANLELRDSEGRTPLIYAIDKGQTNIAKWLLAKGADPEAKDNSGRAALQHAALQGNVEIGNMLRGGSTRDQQLERTQWKDPREQFTAYQSALANDADNSVLRRKVLQLAAALPARPAVPDEATQLFVLASKQLQLASTPSSLDQPIALLRKALGIAPWWGNAYYNLARALEMRSQYDEAIKQLEFYLASKPPAADAAEAQTHIGALRTARDAVAHSPR